MGDRIREHFTVVAFESLRDYHGEWGKKAHRIVRTDNYTDARIAVSYLEMDSGFLYGMIIIHNSDGKVIMTSSLERFSWDRRVGRARRVRLIAPGSMPMYIKPNKEYESEPFPPYTEGKAHSEGWEIEYVDWSSDEGL